EHRHHVEPHRPWRDPESAQPLTRRASDPRHLSRSDRFGRRAAAQTGPRLDLADDQRATVVADDVQLALATSPITREHGAPELLEVFRGQLFALPSQRSLTSRTFLDWAHRYPQFADIHQPRWTSARSGNSANPA